MDDVAAYIQQQGEGGRVVIAAPLTLGRGQGIIEKLTLLLSDGLMRVWTKGETRLIEDILPQVDEKTRAEEILVVIDRARIAADDDTQTRMRDSVARAFSYGEGSARSSPTRAPRSSRRASRPTASSSSTPRNTFSASTTRWGHVPGARGTAR